jgi:hypothetical protein
MSRFNRYKRLGAIVGVVAATASVAAASAATTAGVVGRPAPAAVTVAMPLPNPPGQATDPLGALGALAGQGADQCLFFQYNLGPFGPLGPWGPYGPLKDKPHPACFGGGPDFNKSGK